VDVTAGDTDAPFLRKLYLSLVTAMHKAVQLVAEDCR
jgi:hypothetical protein